jgi:hypothetical protein
MEAKNRPGDRDLALTATLALGGEYSPCRHLQIGQPQPEHLAAAQPAQHHRFGHRPVPVGAQRRQQRADLG